MATGFEQGSLLGGRYRLKRLLGTGGMASVWLARDERLRRPVAVKVISDTLAADANYLRRFRREARLAAGLSHPNLVMLYDFGGEGDRPFLAMEYVQGGTLADRISAGTARAGPEPARARAARSARPHPQGGDRPPRRQAGQRADRDGRHREADRLRNRPARGRHAPDQHRTGGRHAQLHRAGSRARRTGDATLRPLLTRDR